MRFRVQIDGYVEVDKPVTEQQVEEAVYFQLGYGSMSMDNPVGDPDWDDVSVMVDEDY